MAVGFVVSVYLVVHDLPQLLRHTQLFLVPYRFSVYLLLEEMFVQVQALQQRGEVVPTCLCLRHPHTLVLALMPALCCSRNFTSLMFP